MTAHSPHSETRLSGSTDCPITNELGRLLKRAEEIRLVADYKGDSVELEDAREMVGQAAIFVDAMRAEFMSSEPDEGSVITP